MIDYIKISGYKSIKEMNLKLTPINILIGANGSGKSNFISFFEFLSNISERKLQQYISLRGGEDKILHKGSDITIEISFEVGFDKGLDGYSATLEFGSAGFVFINEHLIQNKDKGENISEYGSEANLKLIDNSKAKYILTHLKSYRKYHFHDTSKNSPFTKMSHVENDKYFLYEDGNNLAAFLYNIRENHLIIYNRILKIIQSIAPFFSDFYLQPNSEGYLRLQWQGKYSSTVYGANDFSDGTMRFIALTILFMQPDLPSVIIIDEPELGLHPFAITKLAGMIDILAKKGTQVIISTQSADFINHFEVEQIITVDQINGESQFNRLSSENLSVWLDEYNIGDLWQRNIIQGGQPK